MPDGRFVGGCYRCKCEMWLPESLYQAAQHGKGKITFYCPYGHGQVFSEGESEETILRRERDRLKQQIAQKNDEINALEQRVASGDRALNAAKAEAVKHKATAVKSRQRAGAGVCQCCNRLFTNVASHMRNKHPSFVAEEVA